MIGQAGGKSASGSGAFAELAKSGFGRVVLWVMVLGFLMLVIWQGIEAAIGHRDDDGGKRTYKRVVSAGKAVLYAVLGVSALTTAMNGASSSGGGGADSLTGKLMSAPGGQVLVVLVGLAIIATGGALAYRGYKEKFTKHLDAGAQGDKRTTIVTLGKVGYIAKGAALAAVGVLVVIAGIRHNAKKSGGLDAALHELLPATARQRPRGGCRPRAGGVRPVLLRLGSLPQAVTSPARRPPPTRPSWPGRAAPGDHRRGPAYGLPTAN